MDGKLQKHWSDLIRLLFRLKPDVDFRPINLQEDYGAIVSWKLGTDPSRPSKRSKRIRIIIPREVVEYYQDKSEFRQKQDDEKLTQFIKLNLDIFEPNHDYPRNIPPPEVQWIAGQNVLNS